MKEALFILAIVIILTGIIAQFCDLPEVRRWIVEKTGKSPYDWGYIAGRKTRYLITGRKDDGFTEQDETPRNDKGI